MKKKNEKTGGDAAVRMHGGRQCFGGLVYAEESDQVSDLTEDTGTGDVQEAEDEQIPKNDVEEAEDEQASENDVEEAEDDQTSGNNVHEAEDNQTSESDVQEIDDAEKIQESDGKETGDQNEESIEAQALRKQHY